LGRAAKCHAQPSESYLLGDSPDDIEPAARAGVATVAVRSGGWSDSDLKDAVDIFADVAEVLAHYDESSFARSGSGA